MVVSIAGVDLRRGTPIEPETLWAPGVARKETAHVETVRSAAQIAPPSFFDVKPHRLYESETGGIDCSSPSGKHSDPLCRKSQNGRSRHRSAEPATAMTFQYRGEIVVSHPIDGLADRGSN